MFPESSYYWIPGLLVLASPLLFRLLSSSKKPQGLTDTDTTSPTITHTVVILGAGMAGVPLTHHLLKHTPASVGLRVVLVSPNDELLWAYATVRAILPDTFGDEKIFLPLGPGFAKYAVSKFEHVVGMAQSLDPEANRVVVSTKADEHQRSIDYDTLVIATGSSFKEAMPFKNLTDTAATKDEIHNLRKKIAEARSIVVAGAGLTGVEVAGELGQEYGLAGTKEITLIADDALPLGPEAREDGRRTVVHELASSSERSALSSSTLVTASVPCPELCRGLRMRTLKSASSTPSSHGQDGASAARRAASSALIGPLPSLVAITRSPSTMTFTVASATTAPSSRRSTITR